MSIDEIIQHNYGKLHKLLPNVDSEVYDGLTYEDLFQSTLITCLNKYRNQDFEENEGFEAVKKAVLTEILFSKKRKGQSIITLIGDEMSALRQPFDYKEE